MIQIGGTKRIPIFLSQGTYGCVYRPGIQCGTNATLGNNFITKIHRKEKYAEKEISNSNKIKKLISQHSKYFAVSIADCSIDISKISGNEMQKCDFIKNNTPSEKPTTEFISTKMRYIDGITLGDFLDNVKIKVDSQIFSITKRLYQSVQKLHSAKIVHYDLKENNMIIRINNGLPILIDFGLSKILIYLSVMIIKSSIIYHLKLIRNIFTFMLPIIRLGMLISMLFVMLYKN